MSFWKYVLKATINQWRKKLFLHSFSPWTELGCC